MSIASRIEAMNDHVTDVYDTFALSETTIDFNKNIENIPKGIKKSYLDIMNNGIDMVWDNWEKVTGTGNTLTLNHTAYANMKVNLMGNTSQNTIAEEVGTEVIGNDIYVTDVDNTKESYRIVMGNTSQETTTGKNLLSMPNVSSTTTSVGITYSVNNNVIYLSGTSSNSIFLNDIFNNLGTMSGNYTMSFKCTNIPDNKLSCGLRNGSSVTLLGGAIGNDKVYTENINDTMTKSFIYINSGVNITDGTIEIQVEAGATKTNFEKYTGGQPSPSPSYPQEIKTVSGYADIVDGSEISIGNYPLNLEGYNLFDKSSATIISKTVNGNTLYGYKLPKATRRDWQGALRNFRVSEGTVDTYASYSVYEDVSGTLTSVWSISGSTSHAITNSDNDFYLLCNSVSDAETPQTHLQNLDIMMSYSTKKYLPYRDPIELCKIGNYQDKFVKNGDKWYLHKEIGKVVLNGTENWVYPTQTGSSTYYRYENQDFRNNDCMVHSQYLSDNFKYNGTTGQVEQNVITNTSSANTNRLWITIDTSLMSGTTENDFKTWLSTHNTEVYYVLATPTDTEITDEVLIGELETIYVGELYDEVYSISDINKFAIIDFKYNVVTPSPSPKRPSDVNVVTGDNTINVEGKNLFNESTKMGGYYFENNGTISSGGSVRNCLFYFKCRPSTAYSFSFSAYENMSIINISTTKEKPKAGVSVGSGSPITLANLKKENYITPNDAEYIVIRFQSVTNTNIANNPFSNFVTNFQAEQNSTATTYEPYQSTTYPINLPEGMFLGSIGDYKDTFFKAVEGNLVYDSLDSATKQTLDSNEWYLEKKIGKVVLDGTESWILSNNRDTYTSFYYVNNNVMLATRCFCDKLINPSNYGNITGASQEGIAVHGTVYRIYVSVPNTNATTAQQLETWLSSNNLTTYYVLATPTYTKIEGTLASQLETVYRAKSEEGQTNISQTNNDLPFEISATALGEMS